MAENTSSTATEWANMRKFGWIDYTILLTMTTLSVSIGLYHAFKATKSKIIYRNVNTDRSSMKTFPVTISLISSILSGITMLGAATDTYLYGTNYLFLAFGALLVPVLSNFLILPVLYDTKSKSLFDYLEHRFDKKISLISSFLYIVITFILVATLTYVGGLALSKFTDIDVHIITTAFCIICSFYTAIGGLKTVVWTDVLQAFFMYCGIILVNIKGTIDIGGIEVVWRRNLDSGRIIIPSFAFDLQSVYTFWSVLIGGSVFCLQTSTLTQDAAQKYMSLPTLQSMQRSITGFGIGGAIFVITSCYSGLLVYATFHDCDPLTTQLATERDELLPLLVMKILGKYPGLPGIFITTITAATLSSLSSLLNATSIVLLDDFYIHFRKTKGPLREKQKSIINKLLITAFGLVTAALVFVVENLGTVTQIVMGLGTVTNGAILGFFVMGVLIPRIHAKGALIGGILSSIVMLWQAVEAAKSRSAGHLVYPEKPVTVEGCTYNFTPKYSPGYYLNFNSTETGRKPFSFHHISYLWNPIIGATITIVCALLVSLVTKPCPKRKIGPEYFAPCIRKFLVQDNECREMEELNRKIDVYDNNSEKTQFIPLRPVEDQNGGR